MSSSVSPDLFNTCGSYGYSVPENKLGTQISHKGDGYAGITTYVEYWHGQNVREFIKCTLNYSLLQGEKYYIEYHVSQTDSTWFASHNLGVTFTDMASDTGVFGELLCWLDCDVYVENTSANPLSSKTDWVKVSGTFTAQGGELYIHIGNFRTDADSEIEFVGGASDPNVAWNIATYYIDDVWLSHVDSAHYVSVNEQLGINNYELRVWPNPSVGGSVTLECKLKGGDKAELTMFDMSGRRVYRNSNVCGPNALKLEGLSEGLYHCLLVINGKTSLSEKLVILSHN